MWRRPTARGGLSRAGELGKPTAGPRRSWPTRRCGGHERFVRRGQPAVIFLISQDLRAARYSLHFVKAALESSPLLRKEIVQITADRIDLKNGNQIACVPPTLKSVRGFSSPVAVLDEVASGASSPTVRIQTSRSSEPSRQPNAVPRSQSDRHLESLEQGRAPVAVLRGRD